MRTRVLLDDVLIDRRVEDVFAFLTDMTNSPGWGRTSSTERLGDGVLGVGSRFPDMEPAEDGGQSKETEITAFEPPTFFSYRSVSETGVGEFAEVSLQELDGRTRVQPTAEVHIPGMRQDKEQAFIKEIQIGVHAILDNLKSLLEEGREGAS
jgi:uncharacterized protein YndB with AHSA1/START domain